MKILAVVMAGGFGSRLEPLSTPDRPKQFLQLIGQRTMLQLTVERALQFADRVLVVTRRRWSDLAHEQLRGYRCDIITPTEPPGTLWCLAVGMMHGAAEGSDAVVAMPADHAVDDHFYLACREAAIMAWEHKGLACIGAQPHWPEPGYGYIVPAPTGLPAVSRFIEKPDHHQAAALIDAGALWNTGVYALGAPMPAVFGPKDHSIDRALAEPAAQQGLLRCVRFMGRWSDIGSHASLARWRALA